jgi:hypothetical protein
MDSLIPPQLKKSFLCGPEQNQIILMSQELLLKPGVPARQQIATSRQQRLRQLRRWLQVRDNNGDDRTTKFHRLTN